MGGAVNMILQDEGTGSFWNRSVVQVLKEGIKQQHARWYVIRAQEYILYHNRYIN